VRGMLMVASSGCKKSNPNSAWATLAMRPSALSWSWVV
jgi:hypothetical protein